MTINSNKHYNMKMETSDNEQGFAEEAPFELVDFNYQPRSRIWTTGTKSLCPSVKKVSPIVFVSNKLINTVVHEEWVKSLALQSSKNIIFNAQAKQEVKYKEENIKFDSDLLCGNMQIASRKKTNEYELYMKPDSNTKSHFQWFYFKVSIKRGKKNVKFTIKNFIKMTMLYSKGLKPFCRALNNPDFHEFRQLETPVKFYEDPETGYFQLEFSYNFEYDKDEVQFCSQPPYSFESLQKSIQRIQCKKLTLGKTVLGIKIPYLIFEAQKQTKAVAVAIARQHPGEAVGSWMMQGLLTQLSERKNNNYITWVVVPMVNIDGVNLGNNRTGVLGHDFNRNWSSDEMSRAKNSKLFPETSGVVSIIKSLKKKYPRKVKFFLDLHGHSSQPNVFTYGPPHEEKSEYFFQCRIFPELLSRKNPNFKLDQCSFVIHPQKKNAARSVVFYNLGIPFTYTVESTFGLMNNKNAVTEDFIKMGYDIGLCSHQFIHTAIIKDTSQTIMEEIKSKYANARNEENEEYDSASEASDSDPNLKKIQDIVLYQDSEETMKSGRYLEKGEFASQEVRRKVGLRSSHISLEKDPYEKNVMRPGRPEKKRISTEGELVMKKKECLFPHISTKNGKMSFDQKYTEKNEILKHIKVEDIQKRLHKLRHSKMGKKILIINAYSS